MKGRKVNYINKAAESMRGHFSHGATHVIIYDGKNPQEFPCQSSSGYLPRVL